MTQNVDSTPRTRVAWFVLTPAGEAGPYWIQSAARDEARRMGWKVVRREVEVDAEGKPV